MKQKLLLIIVLVAAALLLAAGIAYAGDTYYWLLYNGDDAYVLCADGQFTIDVNGDDSIHLVCHSGANTDGRE